MGAACEIGTPDLVVNDTGNGSNGYGWNAEIVTDGRYAEPFVADAYPARIDGVCYSFITNTGNTSFDFDIVVWDSDGPDGTPGTELGRQAAVGHPAPIAGVPFTPVFEHYDISDLGLTVTGDVYIGLQWNPNDAGDGIFVGADQAATTPFNDGLSWANDGPWEPMGAGDNQPLYRALLVRAAMPPAGPGAPGVAKAFAPDQVLADAPSTLTISLRNTSQPDDAAVLLADFTDTLPAGMVIASPANASSTCDNASLDFTEGGASITLESGAEIPAASSCEVTVDVTASADGTYENVIDAGALETSNGDNPNPASATLTVGYTFPEPYCERNFTSTIEPITRVVFSNIDNPSSAAIGGSPALENFLSLVGVVALGQTVEMRVEGNTGGSFNNVITVYIDWNQDDLFDGTDESYNLGIINSSTGVDGKHVLADIEVPIHALPGETRMRVVKNFSSAGAACGNGSWGQAEDYTISIGGTAPPTVAKEFDTDEALTGEDIGVTITLTNLNDEVMTLTADLVDSLPAGLVAQSVSTTCAGTVTFTAGTLVLESGAEIPAEGSCALEGVVQGDGPGVFTNVIAAGDVVTDLGENLSEASATVEVFDAGNPFPPVVAVSFTPSTIFTDESSVATVSLTNIASNAATLTAPFTFVVPDDVDVISATTDCGLSVGSEEQGLQATNITLPAGLSLAADATCEINLVVGSDVPGSYAITLDAGDLETDQGTNVVGASATLTVNAGFPAPYCDITFPSSVEPITLVDFAGIDNRSSAAIGGESLEDFRSVIGTVSQGGLYTMAVEGNTDGSFTSHIRVFIDWNQDGTFDASESYTIGTIAGSTGEDGKQAVSDIIVPADALLGETRMRVTKRFSAAAEPCNTTGFGQAEDYTLVINDDALPLPIADVTPNALHLEAEPGGTDSAVLTVHNDGPGRLEFTVYRALAARGPAMLGQSSIARSSAAAQDPVKQAIEDANRPMLGMSDLTPAWGAQLDLAPPLGLFATQISQMTNDAPEELNGVSCGSASAGASENSWWRRFYFEEHAEVSTEAQRINNVTVASETGVNTPVTINIYTTPKSVPVDTIVLNQLELIGTGTGMVGGELTTTTVDIIGAVVNDPTSVDLVVEYHIDAGAGLPRFFPGGNPSTQTHLSFISSDDCDIPTPVSTGSIGFPDFHIIMVVEVEETTPVEPGAGCESPSNVPWLTVNPASGAINGVGTMDVTVTANAASLDMGTHEGWICVDTNDAARPLFEVPVTFEVGASDIIFQDGFEGVADNPDIVTGVIDALVNEDEDGSTLDLVTGQWGSYNPSRADDINLYDWGDGTVGVYWYGDMTGLSVGGVTTGVAGVFAILQSGDTIGPASSISAASVQMANWNAGADGYLGIAFENEETGELNYGYIHLTTAGPNGFPARVIEYAYNKAGDAIIIP